MNLQVDHTENDMSKMASAAAPFLLQRQHVYWAVARQRGGGEDTFHTKGKQAIRTRLARFGGYPAYEAVQWLEYGVDDRGIGIRFPIRVEIFQFFTFST